LRLTDPHRTLICAVFALYYFFQILRRPRSPLFPYTTLFRSRLSQGQPLLHADGGTRLRPATRPAGELRLRPAAPPGTVPEGGVRDRKSTRLNSSHVESSYAVFCLKKKKRRRFYPQSIT